MSQNGREPKRRKKRIENYVHDYGRRKTVKNEPKKKSKKKNIIRK